MQLMEHAKGTTISDHVMGAFPSAREVRVGQRSRESKVRFNTAPFTAFRHFLNHPPTIRLSNKTQLKRSVEEAIES